MKNLPNNLHKSIQDKNSYEIICKLWNDGFVNVGNLISRNDLKTIKKKINNLLQNPEPLENRFVKYKESEYLIPAFGDQDADFLTNLIGRDKEIDIILSNFFKIKLIKNLLKTIIGDNYKLLDIAVRRSKDRDNGLGIHSDGIGEFGIAILLNDHDSYSNTTVLYPGSHRFSVTAKECGAETYLRPSIMKFFTQPINGNAGDVFLFFKKTWHGRIKSNKIVKSDSIIMGLYPVGYEYIPFDFVNAKIKNVPSSLLRMIRNDVGLKKTKNGYYQVKGVKEKHRLIDYIYKDSYQYLTVWNLFKKVKPILDFANSFRKNIKIENS